MGFGSRITRRDFLNGALLGAGTALLGCKSTDKGPGPQFLSSEWYGYGGVGDYRHSHGNSPEAVETAHRLRDGEFATALDRVENRETYDLVIVGGGLTGLGAALEYVKRRRDGQTCLLLDNHPMIGGEAKENEFDVGGVRLIGPQGSNGFFVPAAVTDPDGATGDPRYYAELGVPREFQLPAWPPEEKPLRFSRDNYEYLVPHLERHASVGHFFTDGNPSGAWAIDVWERGLANTPLPPAARDTLVRWHGAGARRRFASDDEAVRALDTMSYQDFLASDLRLGPEAARYADLFLASACGLGSDAVSAYVASQLPMPGLTEPLPPDLRRVSFPGGNSGFVRCFLKRLIPDAIGGTERFEDIITGPIRLDALDRAGQPLRMRLDSTAVSVEHDGGSVRIVYRGAGRLWGIRAKAVIMATGGWMNRHVVRDLPAAYRAAYGQFVHAPFLVANVALTNWRFLHRLGITAAIWDRHDADGGFGYTCNIRNPMQIGDYRPPLDPDRPTILTFYTPFYYPGRPLREQVAIGRAELLGTSYRDYERRIHAQLMTLFAASGFDPQRDVAGLILNRWGHAFSVPFPGFFGGAAGLGTAPRDVIRRPHGRVAFAHSELNGWQHWGPAADEGRRAFSQMANAL